MHRLLVAMLAVTLGSCTSESPTSGAASAPVPAHYETGRAAEPLPQTLKASLFQDPKLVRVYEIAERIPAVLAQQPCYCYCDRSLQHRSLLDCQRDTHSAGCAICRKEVLLADRMNSMGLSAKEIRKAIVRGDWKNISE